MITLDQYIVTEFPSYERALCKAITGDVIHLCEAQDNGKDYRVSVTGILERVENKGFYENGTFLVPFIGPCRDWFPFNGSEIIVVSDKNVVRLKKDGLAEVIYAKPVTDCAPHIYTQSVVVEERFGKQTLLLKEGVVKKRKLSKFWGSSFVTRCVHVIHKNLGVERFMSDVRGPVFFEENSFVLKTEAGPKILHHVKRELTKQRYLKNVLVTPRGVVFPEDGLLTFNEDPETAFWEGAYDNLISTGQTVAIVKDKEIFVATGGGTRVKLRELPFDSIEPHPHGLLIDHKDSYSVLVVR